jgi:hypothetical protein
MFLSIGCFIFLISPQNIKAEYSQTKYVVDAAGGTNSSLTYLSITAIGQGTPVGVSSNPSYVQLRVIDGVPSLAYQDNDDTIGKYVRALDADGGSWGDPHIVNLQRTEWISMTMVNGRPGITYDAGDFLYYSLIVEPSVTINWIAVGTKP